MPSGRPTLGTARKSTGGLAPRKQLATRPVRRAPPGAHTHITTLDSSDSSDDYFKCFIPVKLDEIVKPKFISRRQQYTEQTMKIYKEKTKLHRDWLMDEVKNNTKVGNEIKNEMSNRNSKIIPKDHLRSINKDWNCDDPKVRDEIRSLLTKNWDSWLLEHDVSNKSFVIGQIIDTENPAVKHGLKKNKHYGLFAVKPIKKYTLLFEYTGVVKPVGEAAKGEQFDHFNLIGHLDGDRDKNIWGANPEDELVVDPSLYHNEGLYINDYRHNVMINDEMEAIHGPVRTQNVQFYEVLVDGWPRIFAVSCRDIKGAEELLTDYGSKYWDNYCAITKTKTSKGYRAISHAKHTLFVFGYLRTEIEQKYNFCLPSEIKYYCSKWAELCLDTVVLKYSYNEINNFVDALCTKFTVIKDALPLKDESFKLLYRSSKHGLSASKFHELCDDKGPTVTFIHNSYGYVFGGYTSETWKCAADVTGWCFRSDETAFLYNIRNKRRDISDGNVTIYPIATNNGRYAICCGSDYLPTFGNGSDIDVKENRDGFCRCNCSYNIEDYSRFCGEKHWEIQEIEVFSLSIDGLITMDNTDSESQRKTK